MDETLLSWYQALQLLALGPCLFMSFFLCVVGRKPAQVPVPFFYFISLSCSFLMPLRDVLAMGDGLYTLLLILAEAEPALSFLLIVQFMSGRAPKPLYWAILAIPFIGGSQMAYASVMTESEVCFINNLCATPLVIHKLYEIFSISFTCLLIVIMYRRLHREMGERNRREVKQKYALVLALVALNIVLLCIDFLQISDYADLQHARLAKTVVRIGFIYLVLTSVFRVFDRSLEVDYARIPSLAPQEPSERERKLAERVKSVLDEEKLYRDMELSRESLARKLAVTESVLSRAVNQCFQENISMLINRYRVEEAKTRLDGETTTITIIAFDVGFSSIPSFNRVFKQLSGLSPTEYRQRNEETSLKRPQKT